MNSEPHAQRGSVTGPFAASSAAPTALILAAGIGQRLGGDGRPKCLLEFGGRSLLARHIALLHEAGVTAITVVVGYRAGSVCGALSNGVKTVFNPDFAEGSTVSLWAGREALCTGGPVLLMDADVIYDQRMLGRLLGGRAPNTLLLDRSLEPGDEPVKLCIRDGRIVDFHKRPQEPHDWRGESVGFFRFTPDTAVELAERAAAYVSGGGRHMEYEEPIRDMIVSSPPGRFGFEDITGLPWTEIDFPEDVERARALLPELVP